MLWPYVCTWKILPMTQQATVCVVTIYDRVTVQVAWQAELFSNRSMRPAHDFVMASEYVELARIHRALREVPPRCLVALKTDCLVYQSLPRKFVHTVEALTRRRHRDGTSKSTATLSGMPGTGKTHLARQIMSQLSQLGEEVTLISKTHCRESRFGRSGSRWEGA